MNPVRQSQMGSILHHDCILHCKGCVVPKTASWCTFFYRNLLKTFHIIKDIHIREEEQASNRSWKTNGQECPLLLIICPITSRNKTLFVSVKWLSKHQNIIQILFLAKITTLQLPVNLWIWDVGRCKRAEFSSVHYCYSITLR